MNRRLPPGSQQTGQRPRAPRPQAPKWVSGVIEMVPCPHCGKGNDFRELRNQQLLDTGHKPVCDHCGQLMEIVGVQDIVVVAVRAVRNVALPAGGAAPAAPARTISHQQLRRLK